MPGSLGSWESAPPAACPLPSQAVLHTMRTYRATRASTSQPARISRVQQQQGPSGNTVVVGEIADDPFRAGIQFRSDDG